MLRTLSLGLLLVCVDYFTKFWANVKLTQGVAYEVINCLNFTLAYNYGAAFSFLNYRGGIQRYIFSITAVLVISVIGYLLYTKKYKSKQEKLAFVLILSGAIGNLIDRLTFGYVIDFIDIYWEKWHWPVFNLADSYICIGVFCLLVCSNNNKT